MQGFVKSGQLHAFFAALEAGCESMTEAVAGARAVFDVIKDSEHRSAHATGPGASHQIAS
jgi:hypothetical protein